jgi:hypothetical protein
MEAIDENKNKTKKENLYIRLVLYWAIDLLFAAVCFPVVVNTLLKTVGNIQQQITLTGMFSS